VPADGDVAATRDPDGNSCVSDIFREVDEEVRREQLKKLWQRYGNLAVALAVLVIAAVAGWRGYQWWDARKAAEAGAAFEAAAQLASEDKHAEAEAAFAKLATDGTRGYRMLARYREAGELAQKDAKGAIKLYDELAADAANGQVMQDLAALRAGFLLVDTAALDEMQRRLEPLTAAQRAFRHTARELLALAAWRAGDTTATKKWFDMIATDSETPASTRTRIDVLMALVGADGKG
jgi:hypothetical protein